MRHMVGLNALALHRRLWAIVTTLSRGWGWTPSKTRNAPPNSDYPLQRLGLNAKTFLLMVTNKNVCVPLDCWKRTDDPWKVPSLFQRLCARQSGRHFSGDSRLSREITGFPPELVPSVEKARTLPIRYTCEGQPVTKPRLTFALRQSFGRRLHRLFPWNERPNKCGRKERDCQGALLTISAFYAIIVAYIDNEKTSTICKNTDITAWPHFSHHDV